MAKKTQHPHIVGDPLDADRLTAEAVAVATARAAVTRSVDSVHTEARRLQSSREIARRLADHVQRNNFTERIVASMGLRGT